MSENNMNAIEKKEESTITSEVALENIITNAMKTFFILFQLFLFLSFNYLANYHTWNSFFIFT